MQLSKKMTRYEFHCFLDKNEKQVKDLYLKKDLTARMVAERFNIHFEPHITKCLFRHFGAKGKGLGGARVNSGNKKGVIFCDCRKLPKNCVCQKTKKK